MAQVLTKKNRKPKSQQAEPAPHWLDAAADGFFGAWGRLEGVIIRFFAPLSEELEGVGRDLEALDAPAKPLMQLPRDARRRGTTGFLQIFSGADRLALFGELAPEEPARAEPRTPEERAAKTQLIIGAATVGVNILAALYIPPLFLLGTVGLLYQARFMFKEAYRAAVHEKRINVYALTAVMTAIAAVTGSFAELTIVLVSTSFFRWILAKTESATQRSVAHAFLRQPQSVWMLVGEAELQVDFAAVAVGDTLIVHAGEMIPVDGVITDGLAVVDQHMLTGESQYVEKSSGDAVLACTLLVRGKIRVRVEHSGSDTVSAQVAAALDNTSAYKRELRTRAEQQLDRLTLPMFALSAVALPIWGVSSALGILWAIPGYRMMYLAPLTMLSFMHLLARSGILVKNGAALEQLRAVDTVVLDKTGTLTQAQPVAGRIFAFAEMTESEILLLAASAEHRQSHPIATAISQLAHERGITPLALEESQITLGFGVQVTIDGQRILVGSDRMMAMSEIAFNDAATAQQAAVHELGNSLIFIARNHELVGAIEIRSALRPGAERLVAALKRRNKQAIILSGDQEAPTRTLAAQLGIDRYFAQTLPKDKAQLIAQLQKEGRVVCFVGDGLNDSIALQRADVSVSMKGATSIATTVAQVVLMNDDLSQLSFLFDAADRFEDYMRVNRLSTNLPALLILAGTLGFGWSLLTAVLINQLSLPLAFYNLIRPAQEFQTDAAQALPADSGGAG